MSKKQILCLLVFVGSIVTSTYSSHIYYERGQAYIGDGDGMILFLKSNIIADQVAAAQERDKAQEKEAQENKRAYIQRKANKNARMTSRAYAKKKKEKI